MDLNVITGSLLWAVMELSIWGASPILFGFDIPWFRHGLSQTPISSDSLNLNDLPDGDYRLCGPHSSAELSGDQDPCYVFNKSGPQVDGYFGYPNSDSFICVRGNVSPLTVTGEALGLSWAGSIWTALPQTRFNWDPEGHLWLNQAILAHSTDMGQWILFQDATLHLSGFQHQTSSTARSPLDLCDWPTPSEPATFASAH